MSATGRPEGDLRGPPPASNPVQSPMHHGPPSGLPSTGAPMGAPAPVGPWIGVALLVVILDQLSKIAITSRFQLGEGLPILPVFDLLRTHNSGAAFSFLRDASGWQRWFFTGIAVVASAVIVSLLRRHAGDRLMAWALALVLGGALGNLVDRIRLGYVVDFLHAHWGVHSFPVFNVADCAITLGAGLLILDEIRRRRRATR